MNDIARVEPGAKAATWRSVAAIVSVVRYMVTPVDATIAGWSPSKSAATSCSHHDTPASKSTGTKRSDWGIS